MLQRRATDSEERTEVPAIMHEVLNSPGQSLEPGTRTLMESRFSHDFSQVKVHTNDKAQRSARAVNALAYTVGNNVVFGTGQYSPHTLAGQKTLAHELTHTLQQRSMSNAAIATLKVGSANDSYEREADAQAEKVLYTNEVAVLPPRQSVPSIQRLGDLSKVPSGLPCPVASDSAISVTEYVTFDNRVATLLDVQKAQIDNFVMNWWAVGGTNQVRLDGFASQVGSDELNWGLSCDRALAVAAELMRPSSGEPGIPSSFISIFAQGETNEFGTDDENRRVNIFTPILSVPPTPISPSPETPPSECSPRYNTHFTPSTGNCSIYSSPLAKRWLTFTYRHNAQCACENTPNNPKNNCVRKCLQEKMRSFLSSLDRGGAVIGSCIDPFGLLDFVCPEPLCSDLHDHHIECYRECCCNDQFINYPTFLTMCEAPFPCSFVSTSIDWFNRCK
jgi:outer membrane protein OmpA-like peptidoglycan-associated protein